ncbi:MAG: response regulator transcription factor [Bacteroidota bacterium]
MPRISLVEDQKDVADNIARVINATPGWQAVGVYYSAENALAMMAADRPDIILMDIQLPGMDGLECMIRLRRILPETAFLMFTMFDDDKRLFDALRFGASGYILKSEQINGIIRAIRDYLRGDAPMSPAIATRIVKYFQRPVKSRDHDFQELTPRQNEIVRLVAQGLYNAEIADRLGITDGTCRQHISQIFKRLQINNRTELAILWRELNEREEE